MKINIDPKDAKPGDWAEWTMHGYRAAGELYLTQGGSLHAPGCGFSVVGDACWSSDLTITREIPDLPHDAFRIRQCTPRNNGDQSSTIS